MIRAFEILSLLLCCYSATALFYRPPTANLSTTWTINDFQLMLYRQTKVAQFSCDFFNEKIFNEKTNYPMKYIFAILIYGISNNFTTTPKVVWSANRDHPVGYEAILNFTAAGDLVLQDEDGSIVWTTNTTGKSVAGMNLTETGNLVLFGDRNSVVWQSFDHPTDCLLPGQNMSEGQKLKSSVSSTNSSEGMYSCQVTNGSLVAYVESNPPQAYYSLESVDYIDYLLLYTSSAQFMQLMPDGHLQVFHWQSDYGEWTVIADLFTSSDVENCGNYPLVCGRNSICSTNQQCSCPPIEYFRPVDDRHLNLGCSEITTITCTNSTQDQSFITLENVTYFTLTADMDGVNSETCKQACLNNCSCKAAFFYNDYFNASDGYCFLTSEILTMISTVDTSFDYNFLAFIKVHNVTSNQVNNVTSPRVPHHVARVVGSTIGSFVLLLVVAIGITKYVVHMRKKNAEMEEEYIDKVPGMPNRFSYEELKTATNKFSKKLGEGGYGSVYEGTLGDGTKIAVKCLEGLKHVKKSFLAEVQSIGSIHHVNLVRLRGFCAWKSQRLLVYDFMSNGSLDRWIYHGIREHVLEWECRKKIILDIAKGLAYLHEECRQKIVHLDIKPQNILLDNHFNAKVSDFGLSKLIDKSQTEVMTTIKGTPGYIAPEWRNSIVTEKLDVYSFGIVILEIVCGRKIFDIFEPEEESRYLLYVFEKCWEQGTLLHMVDRHSEDMQVHNTEVVEMMNLASWCLQTNYKRRPSMSSVVKVLEGVINVESNLDYNFTDPRIQETTVGDEKDLTLLSSSLLSGPR